MPLTERCSEFHEPIVQENLAVAVVLLPETQPIANFFDQGLNACCKGF